MKKEYLFFGLSLGLFVVLAVGALSAYSAMTSHAEVPGIPSLLAPPFSTPTPAPLPPGYSPPDTSGVDPQAPRPDLVVEDIVVEPSSPYVFNEAKINVTIANIGDAEMVPDNNFHVDLYIGGAGVPASGERGLTCLTGTCAYPDIGVTIRSSPLPWGCQGFWVGGIGARHVLTATVVFSEVKSYYLYAQIDTPEEGYPIGYVIEDADGGENNNIYPTDSSAWAQTKAPQRFTESTNPDFFSNYASSLEVVPATAVLTDINGVQVQADSALVLGMFEEPPLFWGTTQTVPSDPMYVNYHKDYNILQPDSSYYLSQLDVTEPDSYSLNSDHVRDQSKPIIATDGVYGSNRVAAVWQDQRYSTANPDIYLRWSDGEVDVGEGVLTPDVFPRQDWGDPAIHEMRVNDDTDPTAAAQQNPAVAVAPNGDVVVAWQDNRLSPNTQGYWDIYLQQYRFQGGGFVSIGPNRRVSTTVCTDASETYPDIAVDHESRFYVVWQSQCTQQSALWASSGQAPSPGAEITWNPGRYVVDPSAHDRLDPKIDAEPVRLAIIDEVIFPPGYPDIPPIVVYHEITPTIVAVAWHEDRGWGTGDDIYVTYNDDPIPLSGPFHVDQIVNYPRSEVDYRRTQDQPVTAVSQDREDMTIYAEYEGEMVAVEVKGLPVSLLHIAWRDFRNSTGEDYDKTFPGDNPDIYYAGALIRPSPYPDETGAYPLQLVVGQNYKVNQHDIFDWQEDRWPKQFDPDIAAWSYQDVNDDKPYEMYVIWADGRNYNRRNYDIYLWDGEIWTDDELTGIIFNYGLNDDAKIHSFSPQVFDDYSHGRPPAAWQQQPSIAVSGDPISKSLYYLYTVWADNRLSDVGAPENDVFFARSNRGYWANYDQHDYGEAIGGQGSGSYISKAFDSCPGLPEGSAECDTQWFKLDYGGVTPSRSWISIQTRVGDTITDVLNSEWWPQNLLWAPQGGYWIPIRGYLGPGSYVEQNGIQWPRGRYAQYRTDFWTMNPGPSVGSPSVPVPLQFPPSADLYATPILYYVTLFYGSASGEGTYGDVYLPAVLKNSGS